MQCKLHIAFHIKRMTIAHASMTTVSVDYCWLYGKFRHTSYKYINIYTKFSTVGPISPPQDYVPRAKAIANYIAISDLNPKRSSVTYMYVNAFYCEIDG